MCRHRLFPLRVCVSLHRKFWSFWVLNPIQVPLKLCQEGALQDTKVPCCRIALSFALVFLVWEVKPIFYALWRPFTFLMGYNDPRKPTDDLLKGIAHIPRSLYPRDTHNDSFSHLCSRYVSNKLLESSGHMFCLILEQIAFIAALEA